MILVVEGGRVVERGTHAQLLADQGRYAELYRTQFGAESQNALSTCPQWEDVLSG